MEVSITSWGVETLHHHHVIIIISWSCWLPIPIVIWLNYMQHEKKELNWDTWKKIKLQIYRSWSRTACFEPIFNWAAWSWLTWKKFHCLLLLLLLLRLFPPCHQQCCLLAILFQPRIIVQIVGESWLVILNPDPSHEPFRLWALVMGHPGAVNKRGRCDQAAKSWSQPLRSILAWANYRGAGWTWQILIVCFSSQIW